MKHFCYYLRLVKNNLMKKIIIGFLFLILFSNISFGQSGSQFSWVRITDYLALNKQKNNLAGDSIVSTTHWTGKFINIHKNSLGFVSTTDTSAMLSPYLRSYLGVKYSDTASMLSPYLRKIDSSSLSNRINLKLNISDTSSMLSPYLRKIDTASLSNRINERVKYTDTTSLIATKYSVDTMRAGSLSRLGFN